MPFTRSPFHDVFKDPTDEVCARLPLPKNAALAYLSENVEARFVFKATAAIGPSQNPSRRRSERTIEKENAVALQSTGNPRLCSKESHCEREEGQVSTLQQVLRLAEVEEGIRSALYVKAYWR